MPCSSAFCSTSTSRVYGGSGRTVTPKLSICSSPVGGRGNEHIVPKSARNGLSVPRTRFVSGGGLLVQAGLNARLAEWVGGPDRRLDDLVRTRHGGAVPPRRFS